MCGIIGRFAREGDPIDPASLIRATNMLSHRGPDDGAWWSEGSFFFGFRRLAIIDLQTGAQPMSTADGRFVIVFNGEIYNYVELRDELRAQGAAFHTTSDTEVILHAYQAWGARLPEKLVGMFALAIVDRVEQALYLARDRFGEKPLFFRETASDVMFASELTPLAALAAPESRIDPHALAGYLCLNYVPGQQTLLAGIQRLPPASWVRFTHQGTERGIYWRPPAPDDKVSVTSEEDALAKLRAHIDTSVRIALRSDVPVALFLSGGIDSSVIAESAMRQGRLRHAYCLDFAEASYSEYANASAVADRLGVELRRVVLSANALPDFSDLVKHADDPLADSSQLSVWTLAREVAKDYKVAISGDGGDELFGGYLTYRATAMHARLAATLPMSVRRLLARQAHRLRLSDRKVSGSYKLMRFLRALDRPAGEAHFTWNGTWLPEAAARLLRPSTDTSDPDVLRELAARHGLSENPGLRALQLADVGDYLPNDILAKVDRMTMTHGLEARAPFLVHALAEFALGLPDAMKLGGLRSGKRLLRLLVRDLFGPDIAQNRKQGFSIPVHQWLRGPLRATAEDLLSRARLEEFGLLDVDAVLRVKTAHMEGRAQLGWELWGLMVLMAWHRARTLDRQHLATMSPVLRRVSVP